MATRASSEPEIIRPKSNIKTEKVDKQYAKNMEPRVIKKHNVTIQIAEMGVNSFPGEDIWVNLACPECESSIDNDDVIGDLVRSEDGVYSRTFHCENCRCKFTISGKTLYSNKYTFDRLINNIEDEDNEDEEEDEYEDDDLDEEHREHVLRVLARITGSVESTKVDDEEKQENKNKRKITDIFRRNKNSSGKIDKDSDKGNRGRIVSIPKNDY